MINIDFKQAKELLEAFGGEPCKIVLVQVDADDQDAHHYHSGPGLYAYYDGCPEEGMLYFGITDEEAQPDEDINP